MSDTTRPASPSARWRKLWLGLGILLVLLVGGYLAAPPLIARVVRKSVAHLEGGYVGDIARVELRLGDAEVVIHGLHIDKENGLVPVPFLQAEELAIGFVFFEGAPRTRLRVQRPRISFVDAKQPARTQWGPEFDLAQLREQLPFELHELRIRDGELHLRDFDAEPRLDAYVQKLNVDFDDLDGCLPPGDARCHSKLNVRSTMMSSGALNGSGSFRRRDAPVFMVNAELRGLQAKQLSPLLVHYASIDVQGGRLDLDAHYQRRGQRMRAELVPYLRDMEVLGGEREHTKFGREMLAAMAAHWFEKRSGEKAIVFEKQTGQEASFKIEDAAPRGAQNAADRSEGHARR